MMEGCGKCVKWCLFVINFLIWLGGFLVLGVGLWTLLDKAYIEELLRNGLFVSSAYICVVAGIMIIVVSSLGCFGSVKELRCLLLTYFISLFLMFVVLLVGGVLGYVFRAQVENNLRPEMQHTIGEYTPGVEPSDPITAAWDDTQMNLKCCGMGLHSMEDEPWRAWRMNKKVNKLASDNMVPASCCRLDVVTGVPFNCSVENPVNIDHVYHLDCFTVGLEFVKGHAIYLGGVAIGISGFMLVGMIFSLLLFKLIK